MKVFLDRQQAEKAGAMPYPIFAIAVNEGITPFVTMICRSPDCAVELRHLLENIGAKVVPPVAEVVLSALGREFTARYRIGTPCMVTVAGNHAALLAILADASRQNGQPMVGYGLLYEVERGLDYAQVPGDNMVAFRPSFIDRVRSIASAF